jgi:hypothetical protein
VKKTADNERRGYRSRLINDPVTAAQKKKMSAVKNAKTEKSDPLISDSRIDEIIGDPYLAKLAGQKKTD